MLNQALRETQPLAGICIFEMASKSSKPKKIMVTTFTLWAVGIFFSVNPAFAGDRVKALEMAESGSSIEFPVETAPEVATEALAEKKSREDALN
jgi:hypothetical protein